MITTDWLAVLVYTAILMCSWDTLGWVCRKLWDMLGWVCRRLIEWVHNRDKPKKADLRAELIFYERRLDEVIGCGEEDDVDFCRLQIAAIKKQLAVK